MDVASPSSPPRNEALESFLAERLNPAQREAVTAPDGPVLILAGAGSGKTRVISYRIAYLVMERGVLPEQILAVTFTKKAAAEMKQRVEQLIGPTAKSVIMGTFHSICARFLRRDIKHLGYESSFSIYDDADQLALLKRLYVEAGINPKQFAPAAVLGAISRAKEGLLTPHQYSQQAESPFETAAAALYRRYQDALQEQNALDFDDLLVHMLRVFDAEPRVLELYQDRFRHVLVDEYQDVNKAQYLLVSKLSAKHRNLTIVGDDSQAIYGWRGADVRYILAFEEDFPEARVVRLEQNYRSTKTILSAAQSVEAGLQTRHEKRLWTENPQGGPIVLVHAIDEHDEAGFVAREIDRLVSEGTHRFQDVAVMYRMNSQSRALEEALVKRRLPYQLVGGTRFYERREVKDVLAYLRLINNPSDAVSLERIINVPNRGLGEKSVEELRSWAASLGGIPVTYALRLLADAGEGDQPSGRIPSPFTGRTGAQLTSFAKLLDELAGLGRSSGVVELFDEVIQRTGYREYLAADKAGEERWENVMELRSVVTQFAGLGPGTGLRAFLEDVALVADVDTMKDEADAITLLTLHSAKGLEFPVVFITGMEEGIFPHSRAVNEDELDEERRLCYVGITRAKQRLYLLTCQQRSIYGFPRPSDPSRFLGSLGEGNVVEMSTSGGQPGIAIAGAVRSWSGGGTAIGGRSTRGQLGPRKQFGPLAPANGRAAAAAAASQRAALGTPLGTLQKRQAEPPAPPAEPKYKAGDRVRHRTFGDGVVIETQITRRGEEEVRVRFEATGVKVLLGALAPMDVL